jgi:uncharacterized protein with PQ loop repeat
MVRHASAHKHLQKKKQKSPFDYVVYFFMVATPLFELPQVIAIYGNKSAENVSLFTWAFFCLSSAVWIWYSVRNKLYPLIIAYSLYVGIEAAIVAGILLYS